MVKMKYSSKFGSYEWIYDDSNRSVPMVLFLVFNSVFFIILAVLNDRIWEHDNEGDIDTLFEAMELLLVTFVPAAALRSLYGLVIIILKNFDRDSDRSLATLNVDSFMDAYLIPQAMHNENNRF